MSRFAIACVTFAAVVMAVGCQDKKTTQGGGVTTGSRQALSRSDFEAKVKDKSAREVVAAFGEPDRRVPAGNREEWTYANVTMNPATNKPDIATKVIFTNQKVTKVEYVE